MEISDMAEDDKTESTTPSNLKMVAEICLDAQRLVEQAKGRGEEFTFTDSFERALAERRLSQKQLLSVWSLFTLGGWTTKRHLKAMTDGRWEGPSLEMGSQPNAH